MKNVISVIGLTILAAACIPAQAQEFADVYKDKQIYTTPAMLSDLRSETTRLNTYTYGNSKAIQYHSTQIEGLKQNKVDKTEFYADQKRQDDAVQSLNDQATQIHNTINNHGDTLSSHQHQIDSLSSTMGSQVQSAMDEARQARKEAKEAKAAAAVALAVAGQQFNTQGSFQTAISASTVGGNQALAVGAGGALNEKVFINAAIATSGNQTGGVVSATYAW